VWMGSWKYVMTPYGETLTYTCGDEVDVVCLRSSG
jgi:hypothetical protein